MKGSSQNMTAKNGWVQTPSPPLSANVSICITPLLWTCQLCQHVPYPLYLNDWRRKNPTNSLDPQQNIYLPCLKHFISAVLICQTPPLSPWSANAIIFAWPPLPPPSLPNVSIYQTPFLPFGCWTNLWMEQGKIQLTCNSN